MHPRPVQVVQLAQVVQVVQPVRVAPAVQAVQWLQVARAPAERLQHQEQARVRRILLLEQQRRVRIRRSKVWVRILERGL